MKTRTKRSRKKTANKKRTAQVTSKPAALVQYETRVAERNAPRTGPIGADQVELPGARAIGGPSERALGLRGPRLSLLSPELKGLPSSDYTSTIVEELRK